MPYDQKEVASPFFLLLFGVEDRTQSKWTREANLSFVEEHP